MRARKPRIAVETHLSGCMESYHRPKMSGAIDPYEKWEKTSQNPYAATLSTGSATISPQWVAKTHPETFKSFEEWTKQSKISEPPGSKDERVVLLYSAETEAIMEKVANYVSKERGYYVLTAPNIYEKGSGKKKAFQQYPKETLNDFIKRMIYESMFSIVLYTEQGGQIIETSWCSDSLKPTLGLVWFYRGAGEPKDDERICDFLKGRDGLSVCTCDSRSELNGKAAGFICSDSKVFCPFTEQRITKMVFDMYIMNPCMFLFGAQDPKMWRGPIDDFLKGKLSRV